VAEALLYRHWTRWNEGKRSHLFVIASDGNGTAKDLTAGAEYDVPPDQRGEASDINFSPDSKEICFTAVTDKVEATSTNGDLFTVPVSGGEPNGLRRSRDLTEIQFTRQTENPLPITRS